MITTREHLKAQAQQPTIGQTVDKAMAAIERDNPALKEVLPKDYARPALDKQRLGQLIDMVGNIRVGDAEARSRDVLGRVYEYFLSQFASAEGKRGGEFYTPRCVVRLLVEVERHGHVLTPGRYVGMKPQEDDGEPFKEKMARLTAEWRRQRAEVRWLDAAFEENLGSLGFGVE